MSTPPKRREPLAGGSRGESLLSDKKYTGPRLSAQLHSGIPPNIENFLSRLENVRPSGKGWQANCPAHEDRSPSLSIGIGDDGRILLHCHALCLTADVLAAIGLQLADLFPQRIRDESPEGRRAARVAFKQSLWGAALGVLARESTVVLIAANMVRAAPLSGDDHNRLGVAVERIQAAREALV